MVKNKSNINAGNTIVPANTNNYTLSAERVFNLSPSKEAKAIAKFDAKIAETIRTNGLQKCVSEFCIGRDFVASRILFCFFETPSNLDTTYKDFITKHCGGYKLCSDCQYGQHRTVAYFLAAFNEDNIYPILRRCLFSHLRCFARFVDPNSHKLNVDKDMLHTKISNYFKATKNPTEKDIKSFVKSINANPDNSDNNEVISGDNSSDSAIETLNEEPYAYGDTNTKLTEQEDNITGQNHDISLLLKLSQDNQIPPEYFNDNLTNIIEYLALMRLLYTLNSPAESKIIKLINELSEFSSNKYKCYMKGGK